MNAVVMDNVVLGDESIVGALTFIKEGEKIPPRSVVVGNPGKVIKKVSDRMIEWKTEGTRLYQELPTACAGSLKPCKPLRKTPAKRNFKGIKYENLKNVEHN
jgi:carbonic anhydrase/acetyltransferase-like protein (isoleucine patch superfamily)